MLLGVPGFSRGIGHVGLILPHAGRRLPAGFLWCRGGTVSRASYPALFEELCPTAPVTITIATPGVVTWTGHGFTPGDPVRFYTDGALPTGITAGTLYYVAATGLTVDEFQIAAAPSGASIATSGTQSGNHSGICNGFGLGDGSTTFGLPDLRGRAPIGCGDGTALTIRGRGYAFGTEVFTIGGTNLPAHTHTVPVSNTYGNHYTVTPGGSSAGGIAGYINSGNGPGTGAAINNVQPVLPINWIIQAVRL